jgi:hypothetical protein
MAGLIGALRVSLSADTAAFQQGMTKAQRQAAKSSSAIQRSLTGIKIGLTSLAAGVTLGSLTAVAKRALDYASSLGEVSQQLGVTTKDLQVYRYAATQVGISQEEMDKGLGKLTITLGQVAAGAKAPIAALKAIGVTADELRGKDTGEAFRIIADGLAKIPDRAQRAAVEVALFGRTGAKLDTLLSGGSGAINELSNAAEKLGIVLSDDQIQRADETADKMAALKTVLEANIAGVVADNANAILKMVDALAQLIAAIPDAIAAYSRFLNKIEVYQGAAQAKLGLTAGIRGRGQSRVAYAQGNQAAADMESRLGISVQSIMSGSRARPSGAGGGSIDPFLAGGGGGKKGKSAEQLANEAERLRKDQLRDEYQFTSDQRRNQIDIIQAQMDLTEDYSDRSTLATQILDLERDQEQAALAQAVALGDLTQARADELAVQQEKLDALKRDKLVLDEQYDRRREVLQIDETVLDIERDKLDGQSRLAETAAEQRAVELRILDLAYRQERARLEAVMADERASYGDKESARLRLGSLGDRMAADRAGVIRGTMGPMEAFLDSLPDTAAKANEAFEALAANGLSSLIDGIAEAGFNIKKLGDVFSNVAKQIIADLIRIQLQKAIVGALSGALGGLFGGSGRLSLGDGFSTAVGNPGATNLGALAGLPKFAKGGSFTLGGMAGLDTNLLSLNGQGIAAVSRGEHVSISPNNEGGGQRVHVILDHSPALVARIVQGDQISEVRGSAGAQTALARRRQRLIP